MKRASIILLFFLSQQVILAQDYSYKPEYSTTLDSSKGSAIINQCSRAVPQKISAFWNPMQSDIEKIEKNFKKLLSLKALACCLIGYKLDSLNGYIIQYVGVIINKKKYIYVNAFNAGSNDYLTRFFKNWKTEPIIACDGGRGFWGVLYDIDNSTFEQLAFNGVG